MMRLDPAHEAFARTIIFVHFVGRLRGEDDTTREQIAEECELSVSTVIRKEQDMAIRIYEEVQEIACTEEEIAERHKVEVRDIQRICQYAEDRNYV